MEKENLSPAQFVEKWLPDYKSIGTWHGVPYLDPQNIKRVADEHFPEALAAFKAHIREETWREACEAQRVECVAHFTKINRNSHYDTAVIRHAPIPEIKQKR